MGDELDGVGKERVAGGERGACIQLGLSRQWCLPPAPAPEHPEEREELPVGLFLALSLRGLVTPSLPPFPDTPVCLV